MGLAAETYSDYGPVSDISPRREQAHQLYAVVDRTFGSVDVEAGVGVGLTATADRLTLKLILAHDFNKRPRKLRKNNLTQSPSGKTPR